MSQEIFEQTFNVEGPASLKIANVRGSVDVQPGDEGVISVHAVKHTNSGNDKLTEILIEQESDGRVIVASKYENSVSGILNLNRPCKVDFTVRVPAQCSVKSSCVSSKARIQGLEGEFNFNSVSGKLMLQNLRGPIKLNSVSGAVKAAGLTGNLNLGSVSGAVEILESQIPMVKGKTVSGHMTLETTLGEGPYDFNSVSGHFKLIAPEDTGCTVRLKSVSGHASSVLPVTRRQKKGAHKTIEILNGGTDINIRSVSGAFRLVTKDNTTPFKGTVTPKAEIKPEEPAPPHKSRMEILKQIESGEISVKEALGELNA